MVRVREKHKQEIDDTWRSVRGQGKDSNVPAPREGEVFDDKTETIFSYLQIFTAVVDSIGHGANDVATDWAVRGISVSTIAARSSPRKTSPRILAFGGIGITIGLALYGYKIIESIGIQLIKVTPRVDSPSNLVPRLLSFLVLAWEFLFQRPLPGSAGWRRLPRRKEWRQQETPWHRRCWMDHYDRRRKYVSAFAHHVLAFRHWLRGFSQDFHFKQHVEHHRNDPWPLALRKVIYTNTIEFDECRSHYLVKCKCIYTYYCRMK